MRKKSAPAVASEQSFSSDPACLSSHSEVARMSEPATELYWSIRGEVACQRHAPAVDDPRWAAERWAPVPRGSRYQCQHCAPDGRAVLHPDEPPK